MRLKQFESLKVLAETKSINRASKLLYLTPQSLSQDIKRLENELGFDLLVRTNQGVVLSEQGIKFLTLAENFMGELAQIRGDANSSQLKYDLGDKLDLLGSIGISAYLAKIIDHIYATVPNITVTLHELPFESIMEQLSNESHEIAIVNFPFDVTDFGKKDIETHVLDEYQYFCQVSEQSPLAKYHEVSLSTLRKYPFIIYSEDKLRNDAFFKTIGKPEKLIFVDQAATYEQLTRSGAGISLLMIDKNQKIPVALPGLAHLKIKENICTKRGYMIKKGRSLSMHTQEFLRLLTDNLADFCYY